MAGQKALLGCIQTQRPATSATLDMDATPVETHKPDALHCYKGFKAYQPLDCFWAEQGAILYSEFGDGNVPARREQLRVLQASLLRLGAGAEALGLIVSARQTIRVLACGPSG